MMYPLFENFDFLDFLSVNDECVLFSIIWKKKKFIYVLNHNFHSFEGAVMVVII